MSLVRLLRFGIALHQDDVQAPPDVLRQTGSNVIGGRVRRCKGEAGCCIEVDQVWPGQAPHISAEVRRIRRSIACSVSTSVIVRTSEA